MTAYKCLRCKGVGYITYLINNDKWITCWDCGGAGYVHSAMFMNQMKEPNLRLNNLEIIEIYEQAKEIPLPEM